MSDLSNIPTDELLRMLQQHMDTPDSVSGSSIPGSPQAMQSTLQAQEPHNFAEKIARGNTNIIEGGAQMLVHALPDSFVNFLNEKLGPELAPTATQVDEQIAGRERDWQANRTANKETGVEWLRGLGSAVMSAPVAMVLPYEGAASILGAIGKGAFNGGVLNALNPVFDTSKTFGSEKFDQAKSGAAVGGVFGGATNLVGRAVSPTVDASTKFLMDRGVRPTPGQLIGKNAAATEDAATSIPLVGDMVKGAQRRAIEDYNVAAYNEALKPIGEKFEGAPGNEGIKAVGDKLSAAYNDLLPNLKFNADQQFADELTNIEGMAKNLTKPTYQQFRKIVSTEVMKRLGPTASMDGQSYKTLESVLGNYISKFGKSTNGNDQLLADALGEVVTSAKGVLERSNPDATTKLGAINQGWATLVRLEKAAASAPKSSGIFTPGQLLTAVKNSDSSVRSRGFARGTALLQDFAKHGNKVLGNTYPDSGTPGRMAVGALGLGGLNMISPPAAAAGLGASALYTRPGVAGIEALLARRPQFAPQVKTGLNELGLPLQALIAGLRL